MAKKKGADKGGAAAVRGPVEHWKNEPDEHDYPAAADYLSLVCEPHAAAFLVTALESAPIERRKAKDLLRASRLAILGDDDPHVAGDLAKVRRGERLSPVLLVRGDLAADVALTIADGYHRICASYHLTETADIPCRIAGAPTARRAGASRARPPAAPSASH